MTNDQIHQQLTEIQTDIKQLIVLTTANKTDLSWLKRGFWGCASGIMSIGIYLLKTFFAKG